MDQDRLKKIAEAEVHMVGDAPVEDRSAFQRLLDKFTPDSETKHKVADGFRYAKDIALGVSIAAMVTIISTNAMLAKTNNAWEQATNPAKQEMPHHVPAKAPSEIVFDILDNLASEKKRLEEMEETSRQLSQMNSFRKHATAQVVEEIPSHAAINQLGEDLELTFGGVQLTHKSLDEYRSKLEEDQGHSESQTSKGPKIG